MANVWIILERVIQEFASCVRLLLGVLDVYMYANVCMCVCLCVSDLCFADGELVF